MTNLPNFSVTGNLYEVFGNDSGHLLASVPAAKLVFTPNFQGPVVWSDSVYYIDPITVGVNSDGTISSAPYGDTGVDGTDPLLLLANDPGLNVTDIQWSVVISIPGEPATPAINFAAPNDGGEVNLSSVVPVPATAIRGVTVSGITTSQLLDMINNPDSSLRVALDALYATPVAGAHLDDDFERADAEDLGGQWVARAHSAVGILDGQAYAVEDLDSAPGLVSHVTPMASDDMSVTLTIGEAAGSGLDYTVIFLGANELGVCASVILSASVAVIYQQSNDEGTWWFSNTMKKVCPGVAGYGPGLDVTFQRVGNTYSILPGDEDSQWVDEDDEIPKGADHRLVGFGAMTVADAGQHIAAFSADAL